MLLDNLFFAARNLSLFGCCPGLRRLRVEPALHEPAAFQHGVMRARTLARNGVAADQRARTCSPSLGMSPARKFCTAQHRLLKEFIDAVYRCSRLQLMLTQALARGGDAAALEARIDEAKGWRKLVKQALLSHQELHGC
jgi:hypothetical protein